MLVITMSRMEISKEQDERMTESRKRLRDAYNVAFGSYVEQEAKKIDQWRDQTIWQITRHLRHEVGEIERSKSRTVQYHNAMDALMLSNILLAKLMELEE
jgi:hypothetical protein